MADSSEFKFFDREGIKEWSYANDQRLQYELWVFMRAVIYTYVTPLTPEKLIKSLKSLGWNGIGVEELHTLLNQKNSHFWKITLSNKKDLPPWSLEVFNPVHVAKNIGVEIGVYEIHLDDLPLVKKMLDLS
jgi:hypothetical protein